jgi:hypothetical protein
MIGRILAGISFLHDSGSALLVENLMQAGLYFLLLDPGA